MAKTLYLTNAAASTHRGDNTAKLNAATAFWTSKALAEARGADTTGAITATVTTVAGATPGIEVGVSSIPYEWISDPLSADFTIAGTITLNLWAAESSNSANSAVNAAIDKIDRVTGALTRIATSVRVTEAPLTTPTAANFTVTPTSTACTRGDRLRVRVFADDAGTMGTGFTFTVWFDRSTAAQGESFVTFTETLTFETAAPSGSTYYLTSATSALSGVPTLVSDFTGADENPLSEGGNWAALDTASASVFQRISNAVSATGAGPVYSYWTPANFGPDLEAYVTVTTVSSSPGIAFRVQGEGGASTWDGYVAFITSGSTGTTIAKVTNAVATTVMTGVASATWANGDKLGVRCNGSLIQVFRQASGSSSWDFICCVVDTTYASAGKVALRASGTTIRLDDFYAATSSNLFTLKASTARGASSVSAVANTATGPIAPLLVAEWLTPALNAVTLGGRSKFNIRALELANTANTSLKAEIAVVANDGSGPAVWGTANVEAITTYGSTGELNTSDTAVVAWVAGDDTSVTAGQRLRCRLYLDDCGNAAQVAANTGTVSYNGASAAAAGDTYVILPVTVTEQSTGSTYTKAGYGNESA